MHGDRTKLTAFAAAAAAVATIGCGDMTPGTEPQGGGEPSIEASETRQAAITTAPPRALDPQTRFFIPPPGWASARPRTQAWRSSTPTSG